MFSSGATTIYGSSMGMSDARSSPKLNVNILWFHISLTFHNEEIVITEKIAMSVGDYVPPIV